MLTSTQNPWIKKLRQLHQAGPRYREQEFLFEGRHLLEEALACDWPLEAVCYTEDWFRSHGALVARVPKPVERRLVADHVLRSLATTDHPEGIVSLAKMRPQAPPCSSSSLLLAVENLQDPGNLGTLIRGAAACRCDAIWLSENGIDPYHPKVLRASAGQWFRQPPSIVSLPERIEVCRRQSIQVLAATAEGQAFWDFDLTSPTLFLLGNEGAGLTPSTLDLADARISIPMAAKVESLNVGVVGTLLLYEAERQRRGRSIDGGSRDGKPPVYSR